MTYVDRKGTNCDRKKNIYKCNWKFIEWRMLRKIISRYSSIQFLDAISKDITVMRSPSDQKRKWPNFCVLNSDLTYFETSADFKYLEQRQPWSPSGRRKAMI